MMNSKTIYGGKWWKVDFHVHTPASLDYAKDETDMLVAKELKNITPREFLIHYMKKEIDCIVITDHNTGEWIDKLKKEADKMKEESLEHYRDIYIFPGFEVNVAGNIHVLGVFDFNKTSSDIQRILGELSYKPEYEATEKSIKEVISCILQNGGIAIPAHVDGASGLFSKEDASTQIKMALSVDGLIALEVVNNENFSNQIYKESKLSLSHVIGTDSHHPKFVGSKYTWVKMETPCIEALKLALHDRYDGIKRFDEVSLDYNPNNVGKRFYLKKLVVRNGAKAGRDIPLEVDFSPWMTSIIGGRGSGKSSVLEYMRIVLGRTDELPEKIKKDFDEFKKLYKRGHTGMLLENSEIELFLFKDGRNMSLLWKNNIVIEKIYNDNEECIEEKESVNIQNRFPIRMFSQKQLYEMTEDTQILLKLVDEQWDKLGWNNRKEELIDNFLDSKRKEREIQGRLLKEKIIKQNIDDIDAKMKIFENDQSKTVLRQYNEKEMQYQRLSDIKKKIEINTTKYTETIDSLLGETTNLSIIDELDDISKKLVYDELEKYNIIHSKLKGLVDEIYKFKEEFKTTLNELPWTKQYLNTKKEYLELVETFKKAGINDIGEYGKLIEQRKILQEQHLAIIEQKKNLYEHVKKSEEIYNEIMEHEKLLRQNRMSIIEDWNQRQNVIRIHLQIMGNDEIGEKSLRDLLRKTNNEFSKYIADREDDELVGGLMLNIKNAGEKDVWVMREEVISSIINLESDKYSKTFINHIIRLLENSPEDIDRLLIWTPEDYIGLKLYKDNKEEDIATGSAGQRTSALLL